MKCKESYYNIILILIACLLRRPGILVLINDSDWEIFEKENTVLCDKDTISFISTLHGG